jgi:hypothetical protein
MIIVDYIPKDGLVGNGHYRLQDQWIRELVVGKRVRYTDKLTFLGFIKMCISLMVRKEGCFFPNMALYDRNSIFDTFLALCMPFAKKIVILHTVSKINLLNRIFMVSVRNCRIYTYSDTLKSYMSGYNLSNTNECYVARYKNADLMFSLAGEKGSPRSRQGMNKTKHAIIWGNPVSRLDETRVSLVLDTAKFTKVTIVAKNTDSVTRLARRYPDVIEVVSNASDLEMTRYLAAADVNLMCFDEKFDFYRSKKASSGVYLTSLRFGIPTIAWFDAGDFAEEIEKDGLSIVIGCDGSLDRLNEVLCMPNRSVQDEFKRYEINLEGCD